jgi:chemotaxis methyl-accepting protein methylase
MPESEALVRVAAELLGADVGSARAADLDRAVAAATAAAGESLDAAGLARRLRAAAPDDPLRRAFVEALTICETHFFRLGRQFEAGSLAIAQDETTSIVYGMPRQALLRGAAADVLPVEDIARALIARAAR